MALTQVTKDFITNIDPNQINSGGATTNQILNWNGSAWVPSNLSSLPNNFIPNPSTPGTNQVLVWNGSGWVADSIKNINSNSSIGSIVAWVKFDGHRNTAGTIAYDATDRLIKASVGVSSVTRMGQGDYRINFNPALKDSDYMPMAMGSYGTAGAGAGSIIALPNIDASSTYIAPTTTQFRILMNMAGVGDRDTEQGYVAIIR